MALLIKADGTREEIVGDEGGKLSYEQVKRLCEADLIERVPCDPEEADGYTAFYCDEEGKYKGRSVNYDATRMSTWTMDGDFMVGNVLFIKDEEDMD